MRYVHLPAAAVDTALLEDATRRGKPVLKFCLFFLFMCCFILYLAGGASELTSNGVLEAESQQASKNR